MTKRETDLARRAVACKGWRWLPGMKTNSKFSRVVAVDSDTGFPCAAEQGATNDDCHAVWLDDVPLLPDLADPATLGCLLALVREAWAHPYLCVVGDLSGWRIDAVTAAVAGLHSYAIEAEALVVALEVAP
jgi:hypothetical protein